MNSEVKVGILFFIGIGLLLWFTLFTTQCSQTKGAYAVLFTHVERLKEGDAVTYNGVKVGTVTEVLNILDQSQAHTQVKVSFSIFNGRQKVVLIDDHTTFHIEEGLLGGSSLEIGSTAGTPITPASLQGRMGKEPTGINDVISKVDSIIDENRAGIKDAIGAVKTDLDHFGKMSADISTVIEDNRADIKRTIANIGTAAGSLGKLIDDNQLAVKQAIGEFALLGDQLTLLIKENRPNLKLAIDQLPGAVTEAKTTLHGIGAAVDENRANLRSAIADIAKATPALDHITSNIDSITTQIASGHGTIGKLVYDDTLHDKAIQTLDDFDQRIEEIKPVTSGFAELKFILGAEGMTDTRSGVSTYGAYLRIEPAPWKFYEGGVSYRTAPTDRQAALDDPNNFNLDVTVLIGWRFFPDNDLQSYRLSVAGGVIESQVGAVADWKFTHSLSLEIEAREKDNKRLSNDRRYEQGEAMVRATLNYTFWSRLSIRAGVDDLMRRPGLWVGVRGELFDNDLRNLTSVSALIK